MVGDGMQCPPSPLLFDPSVALDQSLRDVAEAPIDILALEEPSHAALPPQTALTERGTSSAHVFSLAAEPPAELPAQVQPGEHGGLLAVLPVIRRLRGSAVSWRMGLPGGEKSPFALLPPSQALGMGGCSPTQPGWDPCYAHGLEDIRSVEGVAARDRPRGSDGGRAVASSPWVARCHPLPVRGTGVAGAVWDAVGMSRRLGTTRCGKPVLSHLGILRGAVIFWAKSCSLLLSLIFRLQFAPLVSHPEPVAHSGHAHREMSSDAPSCVPLSPLRHCPYNQGVPAVPVPWWEPGVGVGGTPGPE